MVNVGIVAESRLFREGLRGLLASGAGIVIAAEVDPAEARELALKASPDVLLVDARFDGVLSLCRDLSRDGQRPRLILIDADPDIEWAVRALEAGARGVLLKTATADDLIKAILVVHQGQIWARKQVVARIVEALATASGAAYAAEGLLSQRLSRRQQEIVKHAASGLSNHEIADHLKISEATVKAHLTHIFEKLGVRDRAQLLARYHAHPLSSHAG